MGIRFKCQSCTKRLNVKSFLAGKRGVCPKCGAGVDIPLESEPRAETKKTEAAADDDIDAMAPPALPDSATNVFDVDDPNSRPDTLQPADAAPPAAVPVENRPSVPSPAAQPMPANPAPAAAPMATAPVAAQPAMGSPAPAQPTAVASNAAAYAQPAAVPQTAMPVPQPSSAPVNPLYEIPDALWYVRPPSGGQFGPAAGSLMEQWIGEGRVTGDSLVWREGWPDWLEAGSVLPQLKKESGPEVMSSTSGGHSGYRERRAKSNSLAIFFVIGLCLVSVLLLVILAYVVTNLN